MNILWGEESEYIDTVSSGQIDFGVKLIPSLFRTRREHDIMTNTWSWYQADVGSDGVSAACQPVTLNRSFNLSELQSSGLEWEFSTGRDFAPFPPTLPREHLVVSGDTNDVMTWR